MTYTEAADAGLSDIERACEDYALWAEQEERRRKRNKR
jgi:hypothetical protein